MECIKNCFVPQQGEIHPVSVYTVEKKKSYIVVQNSGSVKEAEIP